MLYIYGNQENKLIDYYQLSEEKLSDFSISTELLSKLPPVFSTASSTDAEIPFRYSKQFKALNPKNLFVPVYNLPHDFLKEITDAQVQEVLDKLKNWLSEKE